MTPLDPSKILFIDIETVPLVYRYEDLDENSRVLWDRKWLFGKDIVPEVQYQKAGIYAEFAKVICIGYGFFREKNYYVGSFADADERVVLQKFSAFLKNSFNTDHHVLCAHNGKEFDFPFLCRRFLINNLPLPKLFQIQGKKPWEIKHIDTMDLWKFGDIKNYSSLNLLAHVFNIPSPKDDMDGSMVAKTFYEDRDLKRIDNYCKKDVITLTRVYGRFAGLSDINVDEIIFV